VAVLQDEEQVWQKVRKKTESISGNNELFEVLRNLRKDIAEEEGVPPFVIFHDSSLREMVTKLPMSVKEISKVKGVGAVKLEKYGQSFIDKIKGYVESKKVNNRSSKLKNSKFKSHMISYNLYKEGNNLKEIAEIRDLALSTVGEHIIRAARDGKEVDLGSFIPEEYREFILHKIKEIGSDKLKPIKEQLPEEISYFQIKAMICHMDNSDC
jgi:ATP-dependent DNA helicase RecQ